MSEESLPELDRITELLADRALVGLDQQQQQELDRLLASADGYDIESLERTAAAAQLATCEPIEALPSELALRLVEQGKQSLSPTVVSQAAVPTATPATFARREFLAWFAAAAAVAFAIFSITDRRTEQSPLALRSELLSLAEKKPDEVTRVAWSSGPDPAGKSATGDVVWNNDRQQGVMRFSRLPANDPTQEQYQLWIFDSTQDDSYPIDGGVFDIPAGSDEVLVKIDAKLPVVDPTMFAITVEKPGGVVVSSRERLPLLATVEQ